MSITVTDEFRYFKLRNSSGNIIWRMIRDNQGNASVWENQGNKVQANDSKWTDLATETDGKIQDGTFYKFGAHVIGPMPNEWDPTAYKVNFKSNKLATFTYTTSGVSFDGLSDMR